MDIETLAAENGIGMEDIPDFLAECGRLAYERYRQTGSRDDITKAIELAKQGIHIANDNEPKLTQWRNNLGVFLESRFKRTGEMGDLEEAIHIARQAIESTPNDHPDHATLMNNLGNKLGQRYDRTGEIGDLEEAIQIIRRAVESTLDIHPDFGGWLNNLGNKLIRRFQRTGGMRDLEEATCIARQAITSTPDGHPNLADRFNNLGLVLKIRYERMGDIKDLEEGVEKIKRAIEATPHDSPDLAAYLDSLGGNLESRYQRTGDARDLEEAIQVARQAIKSTPRDYSNLAGRLHNLGNKLCCRYERMGEMSDLEEAIQTARKAIRLTPDNHPFLASWVNSLGNILGRRFERMGEMRDLDEAIQAARQAIELTPEDHPDLAARLHNLGIILGRRYERTGEMQYLEEAIHTAKQAVKLTDDNHPILAGRLNTLGNKIESRYERTGEIGDLEGATQAAQQAVELTPVGHPDLAGRLSNLGNKLSRWYDHTGEIRYLEQALQAARKAIESTPDNHQNSAVFLNNLANRLSQRHERTGEIGDLDKAIQAARQAVKLTPVDHQNRAGWLSNLGNKLSRRYDHTGEIQDLEEAVQAAKQATELTSLGHPGLPGWLSNLGNKLIRRYDHTGEIQDLEEAIQAAKQAIELASDDHLDLAVWLNNLAASLGSRYERTGEMKDLEEASAYLLKAWSCLNAVPFHRIQAAATRLKLLAIQNKVKEGIGLGRGILDLLPSVHTRALDRNDQQFVVSTFAGVASNLCSFLLSANRSSEALECLEQGRTIIISQLLDDRSEITSLLQDHSQLGNRYQSLVDEVSTPIRQTTPGAIETLLRKRRQDAAIELDTCLAEIRCLPNHDRFMLGQTIAEMQKCITVGSIVLVNITDFRSDAIVISSKSLRTIALPDLSASKARSWISKDWSTRKRSEQRRKNDQFLDYLAWLWYACVKHIVAEISASQTHLSKGLPRVWWIGSGLASSMPFHAAGVHTRGSNENAYCRMISSYTPSIKALGYAQKQAKRAQEAFVAQDANTMLIAAMPTTPKGPNDKRTPKNLPGVAEEMREILNLTRSHMHTTVHTHPSVDQVMDDLKTCRIAHFACHGTSDYSDPSNSGLILQKSAGPDEAVEQDRFTVQRVSDLRLRYAQIAYLSACSTAENKAARLSDEVIHVVSGFQVAGFPHVVGCLWPAGDSECVEVSKRFYSLIMKQNQSAVNDVASALREAVMAIRADDFSMPLNWAQFVHYGV